MKNVKKIVNKDANNVYKTANTVNHEGGKAWAMSDACLLDQMCMLGTLGNCFYAKAKDSIPENIELLQRSTPEALAAAIVKGRNFGYVRAFNILGLVYLSMKQETDSAQKNLFAAAFPQVIRTGNDLKDFIDLCRSTGRKFGRAVKNAIRAWIDEKLNPYYAMKYRSEIADAIRICRYKGDGNALVIYCLGHYNNVVGMDAERLDQAMEVQPELAALGKVRALLEKPEITVAEEAKIVKMIAEFNIDTESLQSVYDKMTLPIWTAVAKATPTMRFLKYSNKFIEVGIFQDKANMAIVKDKLSVERLKRAYVFPFRLYTAYKALLTTQTNAQPRQAVANHIASTLDQYTTAFDWGVFNRCSWLICPDVSGSMRKPASGDLSCSAVAGMFSGFLYKGLDNALVVPWDTGAHDHTVPKGDSVISHISAIEKATGGGTFMEAPIRHAIQNKIQADWVVMLTDNEEYGSGWLAAWVDYKKKNPKAGAILINLCSSTKTNPYPADKAKQLKIFQVFGWNDNALSFIKAQVSTDFPDLATSVANQEKVEE